MNDNQPSENLRDAMNYLFDYADRCSVFEDFVDASIEDLPCAKDYHHADTILERLAIAAPGLSPLQIARIIELSSQNGQVYRSFHFSRHMATILDQSQKFWDYTRPSWINLYNFCIVKQQYFRSNPNELLNLIDRCFPVKS